MEARSGFEFGKVQPKAIASNPSNRHSTAKNASSPTVVCPFSAIKVSSSLVSADEMRTRMQGRSFVKLPQIRSKVDKKTNDVEGDWATVAVIADKLPFRKTKTGNDFSIWKLNDLRSLDTTVVLMMFGQAHTSHWKLQKGFVVGLLNAKVLPNKDAKSDLTLSIDQANKLLLMGTSVDYGQCRGKKKNGDVCNALINTSEGSHCLYHIRLDYQKVQSMRPELQSVFSGVQPKNSPMERILHRDQYDSKRTNANQQTTGDSEKKTELLQKYQARKEVEANSLAKQLSTASHSVAAKQLSAVHRSMAGEPEPTEADLQTQARSLLARMAGQEKLPQLGRGIKSGEEIDFSSRRKISSATAAKIRAIEMVRQRAIDRQNPNVVKKTLSPLDMILKRVDANLNTPDEVLNLDPKANDPNNSLWMNGDNSREKRKRAEEEIQAKRRKMEAMDEIMKRRSNHEHEVEAAELKAVDQYFNVMEPKEKLDERLTGVTEIRTNVVVCRHCDYVAQSQSDFCRSKAHQVQRKNVLKRVFRCKHCKTRTQTFDQLLPVKRCGCGSDQFEKVSMRDERSAPKLDSEKLKIRGEEIKFLNSLA